MSTTPTPRTDAAAETIWLRYQQAKDITPERNAQVAIEEFADFARDLERELAEARKALEAVQVISPRIVKAIPEYAYEMNLVSSAVKGTP